MEYYEAGTSSVCSSPPKNQELRKDFVRTREKKKPRSSNAFFLFMQTANIVLQATTERIFAPRPDNPGSEYPYGYFADITHGIFLVRGENVLLLGEIDLDKDDDAPPGYELAEVEVVKKLAEAKKTADKAKEKARLKKLVRIGFEGENLGDIFF